MAAFRPRPGRGHKTEAQNFLAVVSPRRGHGEKQNPKILQNAEFDRSVHMVSFSLRFHPAPKMDLKHMKITTKIPLSPCTLIPPSQNQLNTKNSTNENQVTTSKCIHIKNVLEQPIVQLQPKTKTSIKQPIKGHTHMHHEA